MKQCPLCRGEAKHRFELGHTAAWGCTSPVCGLLFADPQLDDRGLTGAYTEHYYPPNGNAAVYENTPEEILRQTLSRAEGTLGLLAGKGLLDFGCGLGRLCQVAKEYGLRATGIEPDARARGTANKTSGIRVHASLSSLREAQPGAKFDIVTMWDVIEHLREPWNEVRDLSDLLQPNGWLLLSTPNAASLRARVEGQRWENMVNPTHFYYFTRKSLEAVLTRGGFSEIAELPFPIRYPGHARARQLVHRALVSCRLQGQLVFVARKRKLETANGMGSSQEIRRSGVHATG